MYDAKYLENHWFYTKFKRNLVDFLIVNIMTNVMIFVMYSKVQLRFPLKTNGI